MEESCPPSGKTTPTPRIPSLVALCVAFLKSQLEYSPPPPSPLPRPSRRSSDKEKEKEREEGDEGEPSVNNEGEDRGSREEGEDIYFPPFASRFLHAADSLPEELADIFLRSLLYSSTRLSTPALLPSQQQHEGGSGEEDKEIEISRKQKLERNIVTITHFLCSRRFELELPNCPWLPTSFFVSLVRERCPFLRSLNLSGCSQLDDDTLALMFAPSLTSSTTKIYLERVDLSSCSNCSGNVSTVTFSLSVLDIEVYHYI